MIVNFNAKINANYKNQYGKQAASLYKMPKSYYRKNLCWGSFLHKHLRLNSKSLLKGKSFSYNGLNKNLRKIYKNVIRKISINALVPYCFEEVFTSWSLQRRT